MKYFAVPFCSDETATMYFFADRLMEADLDQTNITMEQLKHIYDGNLDPCLLPSMPDLTFDQHVANIMNFCVKADGVMLEDFTYQFSHLAIIPIEHLKMLSILNDKLWDQCGDDSSTYNSCATFHEECKGVAVKVIELHSNCTIKQF